MGMDEEMVNKVHHYQDSDLPERVKVALRFAEGWVLHNARTIDDALVNELKQHFTEPQIVELGLAMGLFELFHKFNAAFQVDPPAEGIYQFDIKIPEQMRPHLKALGIA